MNTYYITFINRMRVSLREEFVVNAPTRARAIYQAEDLLSRAGKRLQWYQRPQIQLRGQPT